MIYILPIFFIDRPKNEDFSKISPLHALNKYPQIGFLLAKSFYRSDAEDS